MINLIECLDQVGKLFLPDLSRQRCTWYTSQQGFDVPHSPTGHVEEKIVFADNKHRRRQVTRCVGHEIALLPEYAGESTNCSHLTSARRDQISYFTKYAEKSHNVSRASPSARRTSLVLLSVRGSDQTKDTALLEVRRQEFALLRLRGQRLVLAESTKRERCDIPLVTQHQGG